MKRWRIDYAIKYTYDHDEDKRCAFVEGRNIMEALEVANRDIINLLLERVTVKEVVIWHICLIGNDIFQEE